MPPKNATPEPDEPGKSRKGKRNVNGEGSIYQRKDGRWEGKVFVQAADGTYKRVSVYGKSWDECHDEVIKLQDQVRRGLPVATTTTTVGEYMTYWLHEVAQPAVRRTTFASYETLIRLYIVPGLGKRKLRTLQAPHIRTWLNTVKKTCQCCAQGKDKKRAEEHGEAKCCAKGQCCKSYPSSSTVRYLLRLLRAALQDATDEDLIPRNVAKLVKLRDEGDRKVPPFTTQEAKKFLTVARDHRLHALWAVALGLGLRRGEALGLSWTDIDLHNRRVTVRQSLQRVDRKLSIEATKSDRSTRTIPLPAPLVDVLSHHGKTQAEERFEAGSTWEEHGLVFTTKQGTPIDPRNVNRMFATLCDKAGLRRIRVHDLRHSCATLLFAQGVEAATIQKILGHSSITVTTGTYVDVIETVQRNAVDQLGGLFDDESTT